MSLCNNGIQPMATSGWLNKSPPNMFRCDLDWPAACSSQLQNGKVIFGLLIFHWVLSPVSAEAVFWARSLFAQHFICPDLSMHPRLKTFATLAHHAGVLKECLSTF